MTDHDPWRSLNAPDESNLITAKRIDSTHPWGVFWAVDTNRNCMLVIKHHAGNRPRNKLPTMTGLQIEVRDQGGSEAMTLLRLEDGEQREIFLRLCTDIAASTRAAKSEEESVEIFVARTLRWHKLLRGGGDGRLSDEQQKGLLGEICVLERILFMSMSPHDAIKAWTGPLGSPKDFEIGGICIEAKAHTLAGKKVISIANEHQLCSKGLAELFLHVTEVGGAPTEQSDAVTITEAVQAVRDRIPGHDSATLDRFEQLLVSIGFSWEHDYSDRRWVVGRDTVFRVEDSFPRLIPDMCAAGVEQVQYKVSLSECDAYMVDRDAVIELLKRAAS